MDLGINGTGLVQKASIAAVTESARQAKADGFSHYWLAEHPTGGFDAITVLAMVGAQVPDIELGTAIVPTFPRHPMTLAGPDCKQRHGWKLHPWHRAVSRTDDGSAGAGF